MTCINQYKLKNQQGLISKVNSKDDIPSNELNNLNDNLNTTRSNQQSSQPEST